jgi:hypothetical protein
MGHPTLSTEQVRQRNEQIVAYASSHPDITKTALGIRYRLSRETIRGILDEGQRLVRRNARLAEKARQWGFIASK